MLFWFASALFTSVASIPLSPQSTIFTSNVSVELGGKTFINKGLAGFGLIPSNFRESTGDTMGGIGSAIAFKPNSWMAVGNGSFQGTLFVHPDRGYNVITTINYQSRQHELDIMFTPYYDPDALSFEDAQGTLQLTYQNTVLKYERENKTTTGLDALGVRPADGVDPEMPIASSSDDRLTLDVEGLVTNPDGTFWISDEYGPYIYKYTADGNLIQAIQPPSAILPRDSDGNIVFTSVVDPTTGRAANQGFEGLTVDPVNNILYAMLQSATIQDGGSAKTTSSHTRLVAYNISLDSPVLVGEWVVPLPTSNSKGKTRACSEIHFIGSGIFLALSRDGDGGGDGDDTSSSYKQADLFDISSATDIHNTEFDDPANPISPDGVLNDTITPATYVSFVDYIDDDQLARFGLHNGNPEDETLVDGKWESLALVPAGDPDFSDDYFLFTASDNDFLTTDGVSLGVPYDAGVNVDNQFMVFRVTLPDAVL